MWNLILVAQLDNDGITTIFGSSSLKVMKEDMMVAQIRKLDTLHDVELPRHSRIDRGPGEDRVVALPAWSHELEGNEDADEKQHDSQAKFGGTSHMR